MKEKKKYGNNSKEKLLEQANFKWKWKRKQQLQGHIQTIWIEKSYEFLVAEERLIIDYKIWSRL